MRRTKIVCTIGPASSTRVMLRRLYRAGMDVARLNFSHGTHDQHGAVIALLRSLETRVGRPVSILQDLCGPKVRLGELPPRGVELRRGDVVRFSADSPEPGVIPLPVPELLAALSVGDRLFIDDGLVELRVTAAAADGVSARAVTSGRLTSRKGVTAPGVAAQIDAVTARDLDDLRFGLSAGVDWVAASYVRRAADLAPIYRTMDEMGIRRPVVVKIEKSEALEDLDAILAVVDAVMVARGDLGVELPLDEIPMAQKRIIRQCNAAGRPVITATQMLESMVHSPRPTRAEATDIANAILDGTDAVMLSAETAAGDYPVEAVKAMAAIADRADAELVRTGLSRSAGRRHCDVSDAVAHAAVTMAQEIGARAIICATDRGGTARLIAVRRPSATVIGATPRTETVHRLSVSWGVRPLWIEPVGSTDAMMDAAVGAARSAGFVRGGDRVVLTAGLPVNEAGRTNLVRVLTVD